MSKKFDKRKKVVYDLICDDLYTPMKFKELAMLLRVAKEDRDELRQILEALEQEGKIYLSKRGKYCRGHAKRLTGVFRASLKGFGFVVTKEIQRMYSSVRMIPVVHLTEIMLRSYLQKNRKEEAVKERS